MPAEFTPALARASATVTEMGGELSGTSTLVRETDVMTVAGAKNADGGIADREAVQAELGLLEDYKEAESLNFLISPQPERPERYLENRTPRATAMRGRPQTGDLQ